jgi:hypothetical protein
MHMHTQVHLLTDSLLLLLLLLLALELAQEGRNLIDQAVLSEEVRVPQLHHDALQISSINAHTSAYVSIRQHTSAHVSIRQHSSAS